MNGLLFSGKVIKYLKKINYEGKNNGSYTIKGTQDEEET